MSFEIEVERLQKQNRQLKVTLFIFLLFVVVSTAVTSLLAIHQTRRARMAFQEAQKALVEREQAELDALRALEQVQKARENAERARALAEAARQEAESARVVAESRNGR
ncbi:MAG: hypothetical protein F6K11_12385 [Leptolyngbya sp. SIO3F4]|nr:hypothetical protein [Leptolyngbya sp. SIO3F4]